MLFSNPLYEGLLIKSMHSHPKYLFHAIAPSRHGSKPQRALDGAARENAAIFGPMREFDAFAFTRDEYGVVACGRPCGACFAVPSG